MGRIQARRVVWTNVVVAEVRRNGWILEPSEFTSELDVRLWGNHGRPDRVILTARVTGEMEFE